MFQVGHPDWVSCIFRLALVLMHHEAILVLNLVESLSREHSLSRCDLSHLAREHILLCLPRLFSADVDRAHVRY